MRFIYCHPLFDERKCAHRFSYALSKAFENNRLKLERFDYQGTGEANGAFCDVTMESLWRDLQRKVNHDTSAIIGTRLGAAIAFDYCCRIPFAIQALVLIEPIVNGQNYVNYLFKKQHLKDIMTGNLSKSPCCKDFCNIEGYKTNNIFLEQLKELSLFEMCTSINIKSIFIIQILASNRINPEYDQLARCLGRYGIQAVVERFKLPVFWERVPDSDYSAITNRILEWCDEQN